MKPASRTCVNQSMVRSDLKVERPFSNLEIRGSSPGCRFLSRASAASATATKRTEPTRPPARTSKPASEGRALVRRPLSRPHLWVPSSVGRPEAH